MNAKRLLLGGLGVISLLAVCVIAIGGYGPRSTSANGANNGAVETVREATGTFHDLNTAKAAGYRMLYGCVSGPDQGAMGIHFVNGALVDGTLDPSHPEALLYEFKNGQFRLTGAEYVVVAADWDAAHPDGGPPVLDGQVFEYSGSPNRYRIPAVYTLHVWAWSQNPLGTFAEWNPNVSCDSFTG